MYRYDLFNPRENTFSTEPSYDSQAICRATIKDDYGQELCAIEAVTVIYVDENGKYLVMNRNGTYENGQLRDKSLLDEAISGCKKIHYA